MKKTTHKPKPAYTIKKPSGSQQAVLLKQKIPLTRKVMRKANRRQTMLSDYI